MDASCKHTYISGVALKLKSHFWEMQLYLCSGQTYTHVRNSWVVRFEAVKYKLSHSSYLQPHKPVSYGVSKAFSFGKAQNSSVNQQDTSTWKSLVF